MAEENALTSCHGRRIVIFSGGTAINYYVNEISAYLSNRVAYILPVSDNGGSSSEIINYLGGPAIGDIRSRLIRLASSHTKTHRSLKHLLEHRLTTSSSSAAKAEFDAILKEDLSHPLWQYHIEKDINSDDQLFAYPLKRSIYSFLLYFQDAVKRKMSVKGYEFDFRGGSIGNFVFTGARLFFQSLDTAIYWFRTLTYIPVSSLALPVIDVAKVDDIITIAAELSSGCFIVGQNQISHPTSKTGSHTVVDKSNTSVEPLSSPIKRIFYTNNDEQQNFPTEVYPKVNPSVIHSLTNTECLIYGMGSLYTSIIPSLVVQGVGETIKSLQVPKIFILNASHDRETQGMRVIDFLIAIVRAMTNAYDREISAQEIREYVTAVIFIDHPSVQQNLINQSEVEKLSSLYGITSYPCRYIEDNLPYLSYDAHELISIILSIFRIHNGDDDFNK